MKIFLTGAHGVGKTTINNELVVKLKLNQLDSITNKFAKTKSIFKDPELLLEFQTKFTIYCLNHYINDDNFISSRYLADMYAYCKYEYDKGLKEYKIFMDLLLQSAKYIKDHIIYIPIMFDIEGTNIRSSNKDFQKEIDNNIKEFLNLVNIEYYTIKTLDNRANEIMNYIKESK